MLGSGSWMHFVFAIFRFVHTVFTVKKSVVTYGLNHYTWICRFAHTNLQRLGHIKSWYIHCIFLLNRVLSYIGLWISWTGACIYLGASQLENVCDTMFVLRASVAVLMQILLLYLWRNLWSASSRRPSLLSKCSSSCVSSARQSS